MEDKLLVLRCKRGSKEALARIYDKYKHDLLLLAMALLNDASAAEDVVHDVFVSFVQALARFRLTGSLKGYLLTCAANCARNRNKARLRRSHAGCAASKPVCSDVDDPVRSIACNEQLQRLSKATAQLPYEQKEVVILHLHGAMTFETIAKAQGTSVNTIKSRYRYGLDKLRLILDEKAEA